MAQIPARQIQGIVKNLESSGILAASLTHLQYEHQCLLEEVTEKRLETIYSFDDIPTEATFPFELYLDFAQHEVRFLNKQFIRALGKRLFSGRIIPDLDYQEKTTEDLLCGGLQDLANRTFIDGMPEGLITHKYSACGETKLQIDVSRGVETFQPYMERGAEVFFRKQKALLEGGLEAKEVSENYIVTVDKRTKTGGILRVLG